jgi:ribonucleoside-diphosphate reductase alpha chain
VNKYLLKELVDLGIWNNKVKEKIIAANGSIQSIDEIPQDIKDIYRTVWEIKQRSLIDMAADRGAYVCQSQSLNLFIEEPNFAKLTSMHFHSWKKGLKTGMYYLRTKSAVDAIKFTVEKEEQMLTEAITSNAASKEQKAADIVCSLENKDECAACSS